MRGILIFILFFNINHAFSQAEKCDTIYSNPDSLAIFSGGSIGLKEFVLNELLSVIQLKCNNETEIPSSIKIRLTINSIGEVIDAKFIKPNINEFSEHCKTEIYSKIKTLNGFNPATNNGSNVCSYYTFTISCIKWD
jgi:hypothetical protein